MSQSNDGLSVLFAYLSCSCHNMDLVFYQIELSSVYHPYPVRTQVIGSNTLWKEIAQIKQGTPSSFESIPHNYLVKLVEGAKSVQSCDQGKDGTL